MLVVASLLALIYAIINALGAWAVIRRKGWLAALFMLAASLLVVAAVALVSTIPFARVLLASGLVAASLSSLLYAAVLVGRITWWHHLLRAAIALLIYLLAHNALG